MAKLLGILLGLITAVLAGSAVWFGVYRNSTEYLTKQAEGALNRQDRSDAERWAGLLEQRGDVDQAHLIRGRTYLFEGRKHLEEAVKVADKDKGDSTLFSLLDAAALVCHPIQAHREMWLHNPRTTGRVMVLRPRGREQLELNARVRASFDQAMTEFHQIPPESPVFVDAMALAGELFAQRMESRAATSYLKQVLKKRPDDKQAHKFLARIHYQTGAMFEALDHAKELSRLDPDDGGAFALMGLIHKDYSQIGESIANFREALKRRLPDSSLADVIQLLAEMLLAQKGEENYKEALAILDRCPKQFAHKPDYLALRAECLLSLGQAEEASKLIDQALQANSDLGHALLLRARIYVDEGKRREAIPLLERALRLDAHDEKSRALIERAYRQLGDAKQADEHKRLLDETNAFKHKMTELNKTAMEKPWADGVRFEIAQLWLKMNRTPEARMWLESTLACNPKHKEALELLRKLSK